MIRYRVTATRNKDTTPKTVILTDFLDAAEMAKAAIEAAHPEYKYNIVDLRPGNDFFNSQMEDDDGNN